MVYLHDLYNVSRICLYAIKIHCQTSSSSRVKAQERCFLDLNEEYTTLEGNDMDLHVSDNTSWVLGLGSLGGGGVGDRLPSRHSANGFDVLEAKNLK